MQKYEKYIQRAYSMGFTRAAIIDPGNIVVDNWVRLKCQYGCSGYGKRLTCPPYSPTPEFTRQTLKKYSAAILMQIGDIACDEEAGVFLNLKRTVPALEREIFLDGFPAAFGMTAGPCRLCKKCDTSQLCKNPEEARPAMEACGIDVYQTAANCGFHLEVVKTATAPCTYLSVILIE